ncbi:MAG: helix-turn-helix domain-containing protein [Treponema sp.]|nr:helix-turn-helix domain-containing protein [Treponema sp.]
MEMTNIRELLGANIRACRGELGISQEKLAETVDMAANYLGLIECGKKFPSAEMIERIASALGKDPGALFTLAPAQRQWKERLLSRISALIDEEIAALARKDAE